MTKNQKTQDFIDKNYVVVKGRNGGTTMIPNTMQTNQSSQAVEQEVQIKFISEDKNIGIAKVTEGYIREKYEEEINQAIQAERNRVIELIENYFATKKFDSTNKEMATGMQFVKKIIEKELLKTLKESNV